MICGAGAPRIVTAQEVESEGEKVPGGEEELDDVLGGFDTDVPSLDGSDEQSTPSPVSFGGRLGLAGTVNFAHQEPAPGRTDWRGLSRLRLMAELEIGARLSETWRLFTSGYGFYDFAYAIKGRDGTTPEVLDAYQSELELSDTFVAGSFAPNLHIKAGRQVVAWGTSETIRVTDILNPLDLREPGLTDIENLRLPVAMTRLDFLSGKWVLTGLAIHEVRFDKNPVYDHDFYPFNAPLPDEQVPGWSLANTELAVSARGSFRGWDLSLYLANVFDDQPHLELGSSWEARLVHSRITMLGAATAAAVGDFILKVEAAHFRGLEFFGAPGELFNRTDVLAGVEYYGLADTSMTFEAAVRHVHGADPRLERPPDGIEPNRVEWVLRYSRNFLHETLTMNLVILAYGADLSGGSLERLEARYDLSDRLELIGGVVFYQSGTTPGLETIGDNDRVFLDVVYRY